MTFTPPSYLSTRFPGTPDSAVAGLGVTTGVSLNGSVPYTIQFVVNFDALGSEGIVFGQSGVFSVANVFDTIVVSMTNWQTVTTDAATFPLVAGAWHFVVVTFDGTFLDIYIDGFPAASAQPIRTGSFGTSSAPCICGRGLKGRVRGIQLFNHAKQPAEINLGDFEPGSAPPGLVQYFDFGIPVPSTLSGPPVALAAGAEVVASVVSLSTAGFGWALPVMDGTVNPAGTPGAPYSVQAWVKLEAPTDQAAMTAQETDIPVQVIFANNDLSGAGGGMSLQVVYNNPGGTALDLVGVHGSGRSAATVTAPAAVTVNQWTNIAFVCDGRTLTLYVNGLARSTGTAGTIPNLATGHASIAGIPASAGIGAQTLQGNLCTLSVWSVALQPDQIQANMVLVPDSDSALTAYYDLAQNPDFNDVTGASLALLGGAVIADEPDPTLVVSAQSVNRASGAAVPPELDPFLRMLRASADIEIAARKMIAHLERVRHTLPLEGAAGIPLPRGVLRRADTEIETLLAIARRDPLDLPSGILVQHLHQDEFLLVHHFRTHSVVLARFPAATPDCDQLFTAVLISLVILLLDICLGAPLLFLSNQNFVRRIAARLGQTDTAALDIAFTRIFKQTNSVSAWGNLIRVLFQEGFISAAFYAFQAAAGWWLLTLISVRFASFVASWPAQLIIFMARLVINVSGVLTAYIPYELHCRNHSSTRASEVTLRLTASAE